MTNVVYIMVDDLGFADLNAEDMPRSHALWQELGSQINLQTGASCAPTRAALSTGQQPARFDITGVDNIYTFQGIPTDEVMLAERFHEAGFATGAFGKWHMGLTPDKWPTAQGFDEFVGLVHGNFNSYGSLQHGAVYDDGTVGHDHSGRARGLGHDLQENGEVFRTAQYATELFRDEAVEFIEDAAENDEPFFLYMPLNAPHGPYSAPREYVEPLQERFGVSDEEFALLEVYADDVLSIPFRADIPDDVRDRLSDMLFYASVRALDDAVADVYATLEVEGVADDTLFVFASDNGAGIGFGRQGDNGALRDGKGSPYEGGHRVANFVIWPEGMEPGSVRDEPIWVGDLYPTFLAAAGIEVPDGLDGVDATAYLRDGTPLPREGGVVAHLERKRDYHGDEPPETRPAPEDVAIYSEVTADHKFIVRITTDLNGALIERMEEFFDLAVDPGETTDLLDAEAPPLTGEQAAALDAMRLRYEAFGEDGATGDAYLLSLHVIDPRANTNDVPLPPHEWADPSVTAEAVGEVPWRGTTGDDVLGGDDGRDTLWGASGDDVLVGREGDDVLRGHRGDDTLRGGRGADVLDGGEGTDFADYGDARLRVRADLSNANNNANDAAGDTFVSIEGLRGSRQQDFLFGDEAANTIIGRGGNDVLAGAGGADLLRGDRGDDLLLGGEGADILIGGAGADRFEWRLWEQSTRGARDTVVDFRSGTDVLKLDGMDAIEGGADDAFTFIGDAPFTAAGQVRVVELAGDRVAVLASTDGDRTAELQIIVQGAATLTADDFVL